MTNEKHQPPTRQQPGSEDDFMVELVVQGQKLRPVPERSLVENSGFFRDIFNKMQQQQSATEAVANPTMDNGDTVGLV